MAIHQDSDPFYRLPTNSEVAREGCAEFAALLHQLPQNARQLFLGSAATKPHYTKFMDVWRCVAGISAEIAFESHILAAFPEEAFVEATQILNTQTRHFLFYRTEKPPQFYHLFNLLAVRHVAMNYPEYFPGDVVTDTRAWLQHNWHVWADGNSGNCIRYGLLSGFPLEAVLAFAANKNPTGKHLTWSTETHLSYFGVNAEKDDAYMEQLDAIFLQSSVKELVAFRVQKP
ncbi:MAG TPA: hypothetical protein VFV38_20470 [Ktedonobacteraceae bacterium]|nr:hypothetical protein [Ktedonobacteraceae bacterium]